MNDHTFDGFDKFKRKKFAKRLTTVIETFYPFTDDAFVLSLNAKFGSGKTTFLEMWKDYLENKDRPLKTIYINAWSEDFDNEPLIPIIHTLLTELEHDTKKVTKVTKEVTKVLKVTLGTVALVSNDLIAKSTGINPKRIAEDIEKDFKNSDVLSLGEDIYKQHSFKKKAYEELRSKLKKYIDELPQKPLVIFVDELDRVRPDYAVKFLEAIKHIFSVQGVCFVLAVDRKQLESSVRQLYGDIDFENYYRRFITREAELPEATECDLLPFIEHQAEVFLNQKREKGLRFPFKENEQHNILTYIGNICKIFQFNPRKIETFFRIFAQFMALPCEDNRNGHKLWINTTIFLIATFVHKPDFYHKLGKGKLSPNEIHNYIKGMDFKKIKDNSLRYQIVYDILGAYIDDNKEEKNTQIADILIQYNSRKKGNKISEEEREETIRNVLSRQSDFPYLPSVSILENLYIKIENWHSFIE